MGPRGSSILPHGNPAPSTSSSLLSHSRTYNMLNVVQDHFACSIFNVIQWQKKRKVGGWKDWMGIPGLDHSSKLPRWRGQEYNYTVTSPCEKFRLKFKSLKNSSVMVCVDPSLLLICSTCVTLGKCLDTFLTYRVKIIIVPTSLQWNSTKIKFVNSWSA